MQRLRINRLPEFGDEGNDIRTLQVRLIELGLDPGPVDGKFGNETRFAIRKFQIMKLHKRTFEDGSVGIVTAEALGLYTGAEMPPPPEKYEFITKHLEMKFGRHLVPELRQLIEQSVFKDRVIPQAFVDKDVQKMGPLVATALESMKIREVGGNNKGQMVGYIQSVIGSVAPGGDGLAWCLSMSQVIVAFIEDWCQVASPVPVCEGVTEMFSKAKFIPGLLSMECETGTICCAQHGASWMGHAMFVMMNGSSNQMTTFEGNTNAAGAREGDGAYFKTRDKYQNGDLKTLGFIRIYPFNKVG